MGTENLGQTTHEYCERVVRDLPILGRAVRLSVLLRRIDFELWTGGRLKFSPLHHLATPPSVAFNSGVNPRVIDDSSSLKLIRVSLHLVRRLTNKAPHACEAIASRARCILFKISSPLAFQT